MQRRKFLGGLTLLGAGSLASISAIEASNGKPGTNGAVTISYKVSGFTCITCAVGLETLLLREKGVLSAHATYPAGTATIAYNPKQITEPQLRTFIEDAGFIAELA